MIWTPKRMHRSVSWYAANRENMVDAPSRAEGRAREASARGETMGESGHMLTRNRFAVLAELQKHGGRSVRDVAAATGLSVGTVSATLKQLKEGDAPAVAADNTVTEAGFELLEPYRVKNAVIMAAGLSSRFAPISYEKPKGLLTVRGEVLIERQIRQLREAGIDDIYLVLGYKKEGFFYLEEQFGVHIRINDEYQKRNNNSTIRVVEDILDNTYICSSDDYFATNPFERYVYDSYYACEYVEGHTAEYCLTLKGKEDLITGVSVGGADSWVMLGHVYWDRAFSEKFSEILDAEYDLPETAGKLWEDIYIDHLKELPMVARKYPKGVVWEFDSLDEVSVFDPHFIQNVDSSILDNICSTLGCRRNDFVGIVPIKQGTTNLSFKFDVNGHSYVYRHPGEGTADIINRESEKFSEEVASEMGIDATYIYEDGEAGWKLSHYIEGCSDLDYGDRKQVFRAMETARRLHGSGVVSPWSFDPYDEARRIIRLLDERSWSAYKDFSRLLAVAETLHDMIVFDGVEKCLCHNNFYDSNFLVRGDEMNLIDWEYSGMGDYANDLGTFVCCSDYTYDEAEQVFETYFQRPLTPLELRHCVACTALASFYWFVWALYKEECNESVGEWLYRWYKNVLQYGKKAVELNAAL